MADPDTCFKPGNICRIYIKDFLTFDEIEVRPKPHLNFIIGPNGTGKSTILCAICICLGGKPAVTGRGKELADYVKHGKEISTLETELYTENTSCNVVIKRQFDRKNKSVWFLQGKEVPKKVIEAKIAALNIQVDNLCQFLPQDRVANFAKMNKVQLLEATEKAVGDASLYEHHELLRSSGQRMQELLARVAEIENQLDTDIKRNARLKDAVENHETKTQLEECIKKLQKQQMWFDYDEKRKVHTRQKKERDQFQAVIDKKRKAFEPTLQIINQKKKELLEMKMLIRDMQDKVKKKQMMDEKLQYEYEQSVEALQDAQRVFSAKKQEEDQRKRELLDFGRQLDVLDGQLKNLPQLDDVVAQKTLKELAEKINSASHTNLHLKDKQHNAETTRTSSIRKMNACQVELAGIQDISKQRLELLSRRNRDAYNAMKWLEENRDKFAATVHAPMCTLLNMKYTKYAKYVENRISENDLVAFVCEDKNDLNLFKETMDKHRPKISVNIVHSTAANLDQYQPRLSIENIRQYGFEKYMLECIDAPPAILTYLCRNYQIHRIPIGGEMVDEAKLPMDFNIYYSGDNRINKNRSRYDGEWSSITHKVHKASLLHIILDTQRIEQLNRDIVECKGWIAEAEAELKAVAKEQTELNTNLESWRNDKRVLMSRREERNHLQQRISSKKNQIERRKQGAIDLEAEEGRMKAKIQDIVKNMVDGCGMSGEALSTSVEGFKNYHKMICRAKTAQAALQAFEERLNSSEREIATLQEKLAEMNTTLEVYKSEAQLSLHKLLRALGVSDYRQISPDIRNEFQHSNLEQTERELAEKEAHRECLVTASDSEVQEYKKREVEVRQLRRKLDEAQLTAENHQEELENIKTRWLPRVNEITEKISASFSSFMARMGCAGEVLLDKGEKDDDFSKYGIVIKVRFRDSDRLRELTAHHQSGGERAVSTALYLLALQSLAVVPFRCVDEINQGMDPINERQMLNMLMETAASEDSSQYFFVSPKLIPNMTYNEHINLMVVFNSQTMLPHRKFSLKRILRKRNELNNREARAAR
ncbi:structural maintenance of chromosomes protein 5 isoform X1 [Procambarus clarkii]|uniref:structural maintenance of chromosomes protein 5 isoform X1 n=2 Tax=Procambarus clarkii TaxID=6728 RepID=UPI003743D2D5